jgi:Icc-related predicted phosphoesterase
VTETQKTSLRREMAATLIGAAAAAIALGLIPSVQYHLGPATVAARARPGASTSALQIPPLGEVSADTHWFPVRLEVAISEINFERLGSLATTEPGRRQLRADVEDDLRGLTLRSLVQLLFGGAIAGAIATALVFHRRWTLVAGGTAGALLYVVGITSVLAATFNTRAFDEPTYSGTLERAREVIETVRGQVEVLAEARSRYEIATRKLSDLFVLIAKPAPDPREEAVAILHVSDIHANPLGLEIVEELAREFEVDAVLDTGDLASSTLDTGEISQIAGAVDRALVDGVKAVPARYLFVPGNHDSLGLRARLEDAENVTVLHGSSVRVQDVEILGWADPTFSTDPIEQEEKEKARLAVAPQVARRVAQLKPDVLAVHDVRLADDSFGFVPLVVAGHEHARSLERVNGTLVLTVGSTGATGLTSFTVETDRDYEAEVLYFRGGTLVTIDYISFESLPGEFEIDRDVIEREEAEPALSPS